MKLTDLIEEHVTTLNTNRWDELPPAERRQAMRDFVAKIFEEGHHHGYTEGYNQGIGVCGYDPVDTPFAPLTKDLSGKTEV